MIGLTPKQHELLCYLEARMASGGVCPSYREIARDLGYVSTSVAHLHLNSLQYRGRIRRIPNRARAIEVLQPAITPRFRGVPLKFIPVHELPSTQEGQPDHVHN